jgi:nucleotide-binding universal stress UspA family protein
LLLANSACRAVKRVQYVRGGNNNRRNLPVATALALIDFSTATKGVTRLSCDIARAFGMKLILMHVSTPDAEAEGTQLRGDLSRHAVAAEMHQYHIELESLAEQCVKQGIDATALLVRGTSIRGNPVPKILREVKRIKPVLIVMGTHQHGRLFDALFGSASSKVIHKAACPILLVPNQKRSAEWTKSK